ncbi:MAG TPA: adenylyltransferase/cytidyltransferase family protein [Lacunisphaera sp.]|nr:adenylyltransferase/cytidyltransferase family protein [Lacunisphaera sp.]
MDKRAKSTKGIPQSTRPNVVIGYAYVVADLIHVGHLNHLNACKNLCDKLIVGVLTNKAVQEKKPTPTIPFEDRLRMVQALKCVDIAVSQETYSPLPNAKAMRASVLFESTSHTQEAIDDARREIEAYGGSVIVLPYYGGCSTTEIRNRIRSSDRGGKT